jgi:hypothetical protein
MALTNPPTVLGTFEVPHPVVAAHGTGAFSNSITTVNNSLVLVFMWCTQEGTSTAAWDTDLLISGGTGLTWVQEVNQRAVSGSNIGGIKVFSALVTTGETFNLVADDGANSVYTYKLVVLSFQGHVAADPIVQFIAGAENPMSGAISGSLPAAPNPANTVIGFVGGFTDDINITPGSGFTELVEPAHIPNSFVAIELEYRVGSASQTVAWTDFTSTFGGDGHFVGVEVAGLPTPIMYHHYRTMKAA